MWTQHSQQQFAAEGSGSSNIKSAARLEREVADAGGGQQAAQVALEGHGWDGLIVQLRELQRIDGAEHRLLQLLAAGSRAGTGWVGAGRQANEQAGSGGSSGAAATHAATCQHCEASHPHNASTAVCQQQQSSAKAAALRRAPRHAHQRGDQVFKDGLHKLVGGLAQVLRRCRHAQLRQEDDDVLLRKQRSAKRRLAHGGGRCRRAAAAAAMGEGERGRQGRALDACCMLRVSPEAPRGAPGSGAGRNEFTAAHGGAVEAKGRLLDQANVQRLSCEPNKQRRGAERERLRRLSPADWASGAGAK